LLYRGSRDGFGGSDFHSKCDGVPDTITIILTTDDFIFGGFTSMAWDSSGNDKEDMSRKSFIFSVKNPHNIEGKRFSVSNPERAIYCTSSHGPIFGNHSIYVANECNENTSSYTRLGLGYMNNTGKRGSEFFTGSKYFTAKEIEVFTITE
jgi:hypothetical protein